MPPANQDAWILRPRPAPEARTRLFCFPFAGSGSSVYAQWYRGLPDVEICMVRLPGREARMNEVSLTSVSVLSRTIAAAMQNWLDRPFAFYGHSFGALVAFETVRRLRDGQQPLPGKLIAGARAAPHLPPTDPPFHQLDDETFLSRIVERYDGVPRQVLEEPALIRQFLPAMRADFEALETYRFVDDTPLPCSIVAIGGQGDRLESQHLRGWEQLTSSDFRLHMLAGGHFFLQTHRDDLHAILQRELASLAD